MERIYSVKIRERYEVMKLLVEGLIREKEAAEKLNLTERQIRRIKKRFIENGMDINSLVFNRKHRQINKVPDSIREKIIYLKKEGLHRSCEHICQILPSILTKEEKEWFIKWKKSSFHLSHQTIRNILKEVGIYQNIYEKTEPATRFEMTGFGELVQMDTSSFSGLCGYRRVYLILALDDYSRSILSGNFFLSDDVYNNMLILRRIIERYGKFKMLYTDNASLFKYLRYKKWSWRVYKGQMKFYENNPEREVITEIERALLEIGIPLLTHYPGHPRAKGKIERIFRFIGNRFVEEYKNRIKRINELNNLFNSWVNWYNKTHINRETKTTPEKRQTPSVFEPLEENINLDDIFCIKDERKIDKTNSFSYLGKIYNLNHNKNLVGKKVKIYIHPERKIRVWYNDEFIEELLWKK